MKFSVLLAIFVSIITIGFASWYRFFEPQTISNVVALQPVEGNKYSNEELTQDFINPNAGILNVVATSTVPEEDLTSTDLATRNLILSYLDLAISSGQTVEAGKIEDLGVQYANSITNFHKFNKATIQNIVVVPDSTSNAYNYAENFLNIYTEYAERSQTLSGNMGTLQVNSTSYRTGVESMLAIYTAMVSDLKKLPVPVSIAQLHLELINGYLSNVQAMTEARSLDTDPVTTLAGLTTLKESAGREVEIIKTIDELLQNKWGII